jgi:FKBP12-rapamycin complex-associated protein
MGLIENGDISYTFLLKAREDTRLDEPVKQFFNLITTLVNNSSIPIENKLIITTYNVIPITQEVSLIGWMEGCSTEFDIVHKYRKKKLIPVKHEYGFLINTHPNYLKFPQQKKLVAFK